MTTVAIENVPCTRRCVECPDPPEHHWIEDCDEDFAGYVCRHCEVRRPCCDDCVEIRAAVIRDGRDLCEECATKYERSIYVAPCALDPGDSLYVHAEGYDQILEAPAFEFHGMNGDTSEVMIVVTRDDAVSLARWILEQAGEK